MSQHKAARAKQKRVLLIDAVVWSASYPADHPLRNVFQWYARWLTDLPAIRLIRTSAEDNVLEAVRTGVEGIIISGSPQDAWNDDPINLKLCEVVQACRDLHLPLLGVCYGHQLLGRALGGVVGRHPQGLELGNTIVELTPPGKASPLLAGFPDRFSVLSSHADAVLDMPPQCELLIRGGFTINQGFHWQNQLFGVQFHPETDPATLRFIWGPRREAWRSKVNFDLEQVLAGLQPTPLASHILRNFVTKIIP